MNRLKKSLVALCMVAAAALPAVSFAGGVAVGMGATAASGVRCECVIADDLPGVADDVGARGPARLVHSRTAFEPFIKRGDARIETVEGVVSGERLRRREHQPLAQGSGVCIVLRSRSLGCGGASRRATNAA